MTKHKYKKVLLIITSIKFQVLVILAEGLDIHMENTLLENLYALEV